MSFAYTSAPIIRVDRFHIFPKENFTIINDSEHNIDDTDTKIMQRQKD